MTDTAHWFCAHNQQYCTVDRDTIEASDACHVCGDTFGRYVSDGVEYCGQCSTRLGNGSE